MKRAIRDAIDSAPKGAGRDVSDYKSDVYLDGSIDGAINRIKEEHIAAAQEFAKLDDLIGEECTLEEAEKRLADAVDDWLDNVRNGNAPQSAILAQVGLGKSEQFLRRYAARQDELEGRRIHYMVPENMLANELLDRARKLGIRNCRLHRGRTDEKLGPPLCDRSMHDIAEVRYRRLLAQSGLSCVTRKEPRFTNEVPHLLYGQVLWEDTTDNLILRNAAGFWR
jgi:hypothetical protein